MMKKGNNERLFWILQIVGWFTIDATTFVSFGELSFTYLMYSYFVYSIVGILITSLFRWYLKRYVRIDWYGASDIVHLAGAIGICILVFISAYYLIEFIYEIRWERTPSEIEYMKQFSTLTNGLISTSITVVGWTTIYYGIKIYMQRGEHQAEQLQLRATLKEAQLNTLKGQVNPHFMFNSLNNIRGLMLEDVDKSRNMITKLSEMLEYALEKNTVDSISLAEELEMVENYIALSKIQMEDRLTFEKNIAKETLPVSIPPMIIQLLVENAAKHGIANLKAGGIITLETQKKANELSITVTNTGKLSIAKDSTQLGLKNIRQRLRLLYGDKASFSLNEVEDEVVAVIKIPWS